MDGPDLTGIEEDVRLFRINLCALIRCSWVLSTARCVVICPVPKILTTWGGPDNDKDFELIDV